MVTIFLKTIWFKHQIKRDLLISDGITFTLIKIDNTISNTSLNIEYRWTQEFCGADTMIKDKTIF